MATMPASITVNVRLLIGGEPVPKWRTMALALVARILHVPVDVRESR